MESIGMTTAVPALRYHDFFRQDGSFKNLADFSAKDRATLGSRLVKVKNIAGQSHGAT